MTHKVFIFSLLLLIISSCSKEDASSNLEANIIDVNQNRQTVGSSANDLLSDNTFTSMVIELVYVEGLEPDQTTLNNLESFIEERSHKPNGITIEKRAIASPGLETYSIEDIANIEIEHRQHYNTDNQIAVWAFFADGNSANDTENNFVLGTAYWNTSFVIYEETIKDLSNSPFEPNRSVLETTVMTHEFGHILGLTNLGSPMQNNHEDETHPNHCDNENCLMFWATESSQGIEQMVNMTSAPQLDGECITDLIANGGK